MALGLKRADPQGVTIFILTFILTTSWVYLMDLFYVLLSPYRCFISVLCLDLYVLEDDAWIR